MSSRCGRILSLMLPRATRRSVKKVSSRPAHHVEAWETRGRIVPLRLYDPAIGGSAQQKREPPRTK
jgi:hypothetical protein